MNLLRLNKKIYPVQWTDNFLSDDEINNVLNYVKNIDPEEGMVGNMVEPEKNKIFLSDYAIKDVNSGHVPRVRKSILKWISLTPEINWLYKKIISETNEVNCKNFDFILRYVENLQFTEYNENQQGFYSKHIDCTGDKFSMENYVDIRKLSFSIQISDPNDYEGGELIFYDKGKSFEAPKTKGTIIFFRSDLEHEVKPVTKGTRYSIVSWVCGPNLR